MKGVARSRAPGGRWTTVASVGAIVALAVSAESRAFAWSDTRHWLPDLTTGLAVVVCAAVAGRRSRGSAILLAATGVTWFLGNFDAALIYWHRGPLVHLLLAYPGWRPRARWEQAAVAGGYAVALLPVWRSETASIVIALVVLGLAGVRAGAAGVAPRRDRDRALLASGLVTGALAVGAVARLAVASGSLVDPTLLLYEVAVVAGVIVLTTGLRAPGHGQITDLVVELGSGPSGALREGLADALGDASVEIGYLTASGDYVDDDGRTIATAGAGRSATYVERDGRAVAVLVHDAAVLDQPGLAVAVAEAARLAAAHRELQSEVREQLADLAESRRRLMRADDEERRRMRDRLLAGPGRRLDELDRMLAKALARHPRAELLVRAGAHVRDAASELDRLVVGLQPTELSNGLASALHTLAERCPIPVELDVSVGHLDPEIERAAWFTCAEALSNVVKHSGADRALLTARVRGGLLHLDISDMGRGGADVQGRGLVGLADRVHTFDGTLTVTSPQGSGTRLAVELPLGRQT